ncbi:hypothetical protein [Zavarzinia aquatilis]|uniref:Uncharacterized protein n=1 Tax=Zavarzinia aquatilis TaxID=2211142 RepID=A0A317EDB8_9PROT|nr:hypothetical protein [Zavarzinia aquatilis]PWR24264.1 hypothetical protein DKG74_09100 [Zavarzinia aquatilis]
MIRALSAPGFGLLGAGLLGLALRLFPGLALALQETVLPAVLGTFLAATLVWYLGFGKAPAPSPGRGAALGALAAVLANPFAIIFISASADDRGAEALDMTGVIVLATVGAVETGPISLPVAILTGAFYALLLGLLVKDRASGK